jgi:3-oxoacyl-[acyl-carrier protein] reductase
MKNILVTGISKGLGLVLTKSLVKLDYNVFGINRTTSEELKKLMEEYPDKIKIFNYDLSDSDNAKNLLLGTFVPIETPLHGFINNAALAYDDIITNLRIEPLENMFRVNVFTPFILTKYVIRNMLFHKIAGNIIHISSISAHTGYKGLSMYASTKGALEAFSKTTAREWGSRAIRSNCIVAGFMDTSMSSKLSDDQKDRIYKRTALQSPTKMESVAETAVFLLSDKSGSITGQNVFVDSGTI